MKQGIAKLPLRRGLLLAAGVLSVGLATVGLFLPLLPTTPFLLLAAACFVRSSDKLHQWLVTHRQLGPYIRNYQEHKAITRRSKVVSLLLLWGTITHTGISVTSSLAVRILLLLVGIGVTFHVLSLRTMTPDMLSETKITEGAEEEASQETLESVS